MKKIIKWFKENILGIKPIFKIKIEQSWFSERWFCIKFSNNNGWSWEYIISERHDIDYSWNAKKITVEYWSADRIKDASQQYPNYVSLSPLSSE